MSRSTNEGNFYFAWIMTVIFLIAAFFFLVHQANHMEPDFTITDTEQIKQAMRTIEKDGKCYSIIELRTHHGYPVISHTWIPCNKRAE